MKASVFRDASVASYAAARNWLASHCNVRALDIFRTTVRDDTGKESLQVLLRLDTRSVPHVFKMSGRGGGYVKELTPDGQEWSHKVIWLPSDTTHDTALRLADRYPHSAGLWENDRGGPAGSARRLRGHRGQHFRRRRGKEVGAGPVRSQGSASVMRQRRFAACNPSWGGSAMSKRTHSSSDAQARTGGPSGQTILQ